MICGYCSEALEGTPETCPACAEPPLLDARYRLDSIVGRGAMGVTYRAERLADGQVVAIKELPFRRIDAVKTKAMFEREARVLEQLDHPGIPAYLDDFLGGVGKNLSLYLVQTFVEGQTLKAEMTGQRWREDEVLALIADVADILVYLHELSPPVIDRDIKPGNIMRRADGSLALIDFGAVRDALDDEHTGGSTVVGTYGFMAPEQFRGDASPASDLYALGATAVALLSRKTPDTMVDVAGRLDWAPHVDVHPSTRALLEDLLQMDPARRSQRARTVAQRCRVAIDAIEAARNAPVVRPAPSPAPKWSPPAEALSEHEVPASLLVPAGLEALNAPFEPERVPLPALARETGLTFTDDDPLPKTGQVTGVLVLAGIALVLVMGVFYAVSSGSGPGRRLSGHADGARCGVTPCPPVARGLKGLEFGMTRAEANAALPALAAADAQQKTLPFDMMDLKGMRSREPLGDVVTVDTTLGSLPARCAVEFLDAGKLTGMECTLEAQKSQASHIAAQDALAAALTERYGPPSFQHQSEPNQFMNKAGGVWTWEDDGAKLTLNSDYSDLGAMMQNSVTGITSKIVVRNEGPAHRRVMSAARERREAARAQRKAQADREAAESARRTREALKNGKLGDDL